MSVFADPIKIDGVALPDLMQIQPQAREQPLGGAVMHRLADGSAVKQTAWRKRQVVLSATAFVPPVFAVDWSQPHTFSGLRIAPITGFSEGPQITFDEFAAIWTWTLTVEER
jgi:hypothetical protein